MELKILRKSARLTQKRLGELSGVDDSTISLVENGEREIGSVAYASVVRMGRALVPGVPIEELFPIADLEERSSDEAEQRA